MSLRVAGAVARRRSSGGGSVVLNAVQSAVVDEELTSLTSDSWTIGGDDRAAFALASSAFVFGDVPALPTAVRIGGPSGTDMSVVSESGTLDGYPNISLSMRSLAGPGAGGTTSHALWPAEQRFLSLLAASFNGVDASGPSGTPVPAEGQVDEALFGDAEITVSTQEGDLVLIGVTLLSISMGDVTFSGQGGAEVITSGSLTVIHSAMATKVAGAGASTTITVRMTGTEAAGVGYWKATAFVVRAA